jgi:urease accessory protein
MFRALALRSAALAALATFAGVAAAHTGHPATGFMAGVAHPIGGLDHLLAMVTVGTWAAVALPGGRRWSAPLLFVVVMAASAWAASHAGADAVGPWLEAGIAASVALLGALLVCSAHVAVGTGMVLIGVSAALHGAAHALEGGAPLALAFGAGFVLSTAVLHGVGLAAGSRLVALAARARQAAGAAVGLAGVAMLLARV